MRRLHYFVAVSTDGFIASPSGAFDAFPLEGDHITAQLHELPETLPTPVRDALRITAPGTTFDTVLMGANTFEVGQTPSPYSHLRQYVFSRTRSRRGVGDNVVLSSDDPIELVRRLKSEPSPRDIWLCGGGKLAAALIDEVDVLTLKVNPIAFGSGIRVFESPNYAPRRFTLTSTRRFESSVVWNRYERARD